MASCLYFITIFIINVNVITNAAVDGVIQLQSGSIIGARDEANNLRFWKGIPFGEDTGISLNCYYACLLSNL